MKELCKAFAWMKVDLYEKDCLPEAHHHSFFSSVLSAMMMKELHNHSENHYIYIFPMQHKP